MFFDYYETGLIGTLTLAADGQGLRYVYFPQGRNTRPVRPDWQRLYEGGEDDCFHAAAMPSDGALVRARLTPPEGSRKLYVQRIASPGARIGFQPVDLYRPVQRRFHRRGRAWRGGFGVLHQGQP